VPVDDQQLHDRFAAALGVVGEGVWLSDADDRIVHCNSAMEKIAGVAAGAVLGKSIVQDFPTETIGHFLGHYQRARRTGQPVAYEAPVVTPAGRITVQAGWLVPQFTDGRFAGMVCTIRDITDRREAERNYRMLFDSMFDGFALHRIICDDDGAPRDYRFEAVNPAFERVTGLRAEDVLGRTVREVMPDIEPHWIETYGEVALTGRPRHFENVSAELGKTFQVHAFSPEPEMFATVFFDVTEMKRSESQRRELQEQLLQSQKLESVGRLAGGIAHDFNNMLSVILGHAELAASLLGDAHPAKRELAAIRDAARHSADLTRRLLTFARRQTITPRLVDLNRAVSGTLQMLHRLVGEDIALSWRPAAALPPVMADPTQLDQILANLVVNARDAVADHGHIIIGTAVEDLDEAWCRAHPGSNPGRHVVLSVSDDGCGMDDEIRRQIFEPYFTTKELGKGTGLGMATVFGSVKQSGGFVDVLSEPGRGTRVRVYLPSCAGDAAAAGEEPGSPCGSAGACGDEVLTVLLVEDQPMLLEVSQRMLAVLGYRVLPSGSPEEALRLAAGTKDIDILLTDLVMPGMNGRELSERIRRLQPDMACLYMSGYTANIIETQGILAKDVNFIPKPFTTAELGVALKKALGGRKRAAEGHGGA
jgi:two-component system cell cycle sensor histidine kinase/response regulator CckA